MKEENSGEFICQLYPIFANYPNVNLFYSYALSVAFGAAMDSPDIIVACVVGDGEAETGPTAAYVIVGLVYGILTNFIGPGTLTSTSTPQSPELYFQFYMRTGSRLAKGQSSEQWTIWK
jgi:hypothetical protein